MTFSEALNNCTIEILVNMDTGDRIYKYPFKIIFADKTELILVASLDHIKVLRNDPNNYVNIDILFNSNEINELLTEIISKYVRYYEERKKSLYGTNSVRL